MALPDETVLKPSRRRGDRVLLDSRDTDLLEIREPRAQRVYVTERPARVVESFRARLDLIAPIRPLAPGVHLAEPIQPKTVSHFRAHVERCHTPTGEQPL